MGVFAVLANHAFALRRERNYRGFWGAIFWSVPVPFGVGLFLTTAPEVEMHIRNVTVGSLGALAGAAAAIWFSYVVTDLRASAQPAPPTAEPSVPSAGAPPIYAPDNKGIVTSGQHGNNTIIQQEDRSIKRRQIDLLNRIDPRILDAVSSGTFELNVRLQPFEQRELQALEAEPGSLVSITGYGGKLVDSMINNGSLGTTNAVHEQQWTTLRIDPAIAR